MDKGFSTLSQTRLAWASKAGTQGCTPARVDTPGKNPGPVRISICQNKAWPRGHSPQGLWCRGGEHPVFILSGATPYGVDSGWGYGVHLTPTFASNPPLRFAPRSPRCTQPFGAPSLAPLAFFSKACMSPTQVQENIREILFFWGGGQPHPAMLRTFSWLRSQGSLQVGP